VGRKTVKAKIKNSTGKKDAKKPPELPQRLGRRILDTNKIIAGGTVGLVLVSIAAIVVTSRDANEALRRGHRPNIIFSRPIEMKQPLDCNPATGQGTIGLHVWIKNVGNANANQALPLEFVKLLRNGDDIATITNIAATFCSGPQKRNAVVGPGIVVPPNKEFGEDSSAMAFGNIPSPQASPVQAFIVACVDYADEYAEWHVACDVQRFISRSGKRDFVCGRDTPIEGSFDTFPLGSCSN
jgi:hypothetical protein